MSDLIHAIYHDLEYLGVAIDYAAEVGEVLRRSIFFEQFDAWEIGTLCQYLQCFVAPGNTLLLREGEPGDHMLIVLSGEVAVRKTDLSGHVVGLGLVGPGGILGEMSLIDGEHRFATCATIKPTRFAALTRQDLNEIIALHPRLANKFLLLLLETIVGRLRDTGMRVVASEARAVG